MFTEELKKARKQKGMTQKAVAEALKIDNSTYCGYETGKRKPDIDQLRAIANLLDVDASQLLFGDILNGAQYTEFRRRITDALPFFSRDDQEIIGIDSRKIMDGFRSRKPIRTEKAKSAHESAHAHAVSILPRQIAPPCSLFCAVDIFILDELSPLKSAKKGNKKCRPCYACHVSAVEARPAHTNLVFGQIID